ncbi:MAG: macro domain-containing protein [Flavobacteriaceae bacterium]|nr:macro domain-containing protein [Flavobacteriaceae bacterium]
MINYKKGDILESHTEAIVNTVNCEGFMGKGIAYQFKVKYPENNKEYAKRCRNNSFTIGDILLFRENDKIILNFPTKDKWRKKSEYKFIEKGMKTLRNTIIENDLKSVSIPPLGCGNGGLEWSKVKAIIEKNILNISKDVEIVLYEPIFKKFRSKVKAPPKLTTSHLLLMRIKMNLLKFNKIRLQKSAYLNNILTNENYFKFKGQDFGPYAHSIDILSRDIKEYQTYYNVNTKEAFEQSFKTLVNKKIDSKLRSFDKSLNRTIRFVNKIQNDSNLELITTLLFLIENNRDIDFETIVNKVETWNEHKRINFNRNKIDAEIDFLLETGLINKTLYDTFEINRLKDNKVL